MKRAGFMVAWMGRFLITKWDLADDNDLVTNWWLFGEVFDSWKYGSDENDPW